MKKLVSILCFVALLPIVIFLWPTVLGGDTGFLIVQGSSMLPNITPGSVVITKQEQSYQIDDIVSYSVREQGYKRVIVHRIIDIADRGFVIKGDNNPQKDPGFISIDDISGRVIFATPYLGDMLLNLRNPVFLIVTSLATGLIQWEYKRRKEKKEKIRRIRLGLPTKTTNSLENTQMKPKKPDFKPFYVAIFFNVLTYVLAQVSINYNITPKGDAVTGFLFRIFEPSFASTISFAVYFLFIFGLYFVAKAYGSKGLKTKYTSSQKTKSTQLLFKKRFNPVIIAAQFFWVIFILMSIFHLMAVGTDLIDVVTCNPKQELCT